MRSLHVSTFLFATTLAACGGKVTLDGSGGAGGATTTSTTTTSTATTTATATSTSSTSSVSTSSGAGGSGACPVLAPNPGDTCDSPGLVCQVPVCCGGTATCEGGVWQVVGGDCAQPCLSCPGTIGCEANAVCVDNPLGGGVMVGVPHYNCAVDPCQGAPLSCACAQSLCRAGPCVQASGSTVTCTTLAG